MLSLSVEPLLLQFNRNITGVKSIDDELDKVAHPRTHLHSLCLSICVPHTVCTHSLHTPLLSAHTHSTHPHCLYTLTPHALTVCTHSVHASTLSAHTQFTYPHCLHTLAPHTLTVCTHSLHTPTLSAHTLCTYSLHTPTLSVHTHSTHFDSCCSLVCETYLRTGTIPTSVQTQCALRKPWN